MKRRDYETDVLVLGSSASGCGAAIAAAEEGAKVLLVDKGKLESSGNLGGGNDHFMAVLDEGKNDSLEDMYNYFCTPVSGLSKQVVKNYYDSMKPCMKVLETAGIELKRNPDGTYMRSVGFGQPGAWWIHIDHGFTVKPKLAKYIRGLGVDILNNVQITALLKDGDRIAGAVGFDVRKGDLIVIHCKTAVLAMGLVATRVSNNSTHKPYNIWYSPFVTGSQVVLPLEAGASVLNMDITDMATLLPKGWGAPGMNGINNMGGKELDAKGERFMGKYDPMLENGLRRNQVMGTFKEELAGNGPPFFMDMTHFTTEDARHLQFDLMPGDKEPYLDYCQAREIDFKKAPLEVEISERMIGGIVNHDDNQETDIKNLFTSSITSTFSSCMCLGYSAGKNAAKKSKNTDMPEIDESVVEKKAAEITAPLENDTKTPIDYNEFEHALRQIMDYYVGYQRSGPSMEQALQSMKTLEEYLPHLKAQTLRDLMRVQESRELFKLVRIYIQACMQRKETGRAMYLRSDYPELDPKLDCSLITKLDENGKPVFTWNRKTAA